MPDQITYRGTNSQGNSYDNRVSDSGSKGYHYSKYARKLASYHRPS